MNNERPVHHITAEKDRVSFKHKLAYGIGNIAGGFMANGVMGLSQVVYNVGLGVNPALVALAQSIPRLWEAITDPIMGSVTDNHRSRFGRRKPFIALGAILTGILFAVVFSVPRGWGQQAYFYYFMITSIFYYTAYTIFAVPFGAMGFELTQDYHERTRVQAFAQYLLNAMGFCFPWFFAIAKMDCFHDVVEGGRFLAIGLGVIMLATGLVPAFFCKENYNAEVIKQEKVPIVKGVRETFRNWPFVQLISSTAILCLGVFSIQITGMYLAIYYVCGGNQKAAGLVLGATGTAFNVGNLVGIPIVSALSAKYGKKTTLIAFMFIGIAAAITTWFCYNPSYRLLAIIPQFLFGMANIAVWILGASMVADLCDVDELRTGDRREGMYGAVYSWIVKVGVSISLMASGLILNATGFDAKLVHQSAHTILWMRILFASVSACATLAAILMFWRYPVTEEEAYDIRAELDARRQAKLAGFENDSSLQPVPVSRQTEE
ncbi:MAG: MFS transporter [Armatimonadota bacterium]